MYEEDELLHEGAKSIELKEAAELLLDWSDSRWAFLNSMAAGS